MTVLLEKTETTKQRGATTMRAAVFHGVNDLRLDTVPKPQPGPGEALIRVTLTTICGTDLHIVRGEYEVQPGLIIGHEPVGIIEQLGPGVTGYEIGDRVLVGAITPCGQCHACLAGHKSQCGCGQGYEALGGWRFGNTINGAQAEYLVVPNAQANLAKIPDELMDEQVVLLADIASTGISGAESGGVKLGDKVAVFAQGPIGNAPESKAKLHEKLRTFIQANIPLGAEAVVVQDAPARAIVQTAKDTRADLIIMGTHGRAGIRRAVLGSVAESVLHETTVPLLTVTPNLMKPTATPSIAKIVCPVNFTRVARSALQHACTVAEAFNTELNVVYVAEAIAEPQVKEVENAFLQWVDPHVRERCSYNRIVTLHDDAAARVLELASECGADVLVIGAQHRRFSDTTIFGTTTDRLTRFSHCPVLTVTRSAVVEERIAEVMSAGA